MDTKELCEFKGIGEAKAIGIITTLEIGRRRAASEILQKPKITSGKDVFKLMSHLGELNHEEFWVLFLNQANRVLLQEQLSMGGITQTVVDQRLIFSKALQQKAVSIILVHNHPSGNLDPSDADKKLTQNMVKGAELLGITILDHLIVNQTHYFSFADEGIL